MSARRIPAFLLIALSALLELAVPVFADDGPLTVNMVRGSVIGIERDEPGSLQFGDRLEVSFVVGDDEIPVGAWCVDDERFDLDGRYYLMARPVERSGEPSPGMVARKVDLKGEERSRWLETALSGDCTGAVLALGLDQRDTARGLDLMRQAAEADNAEAQRQYADELSRRKRWHGADISDQEIFSWQLKAAENGSWIAPLDVAHFYLRRYVRSAIGGSGNPQDLTEAERWFREAAKRNVFSDRLDPLYDFGSTLSSLTNRNDKSKGVSILREGAQAGSRRSQESLREMGLDW